MKETPEDIQRLLKEITDHFDKEDVMIRERQIRTWRKLKLLWEGFSQTWYSETAHDWRIWDQSNEEDSEQSAYDKPVNVFRAYLESIIAALSVTVPPIKCYPDNADDPLDLSTARAGDKIGQLIYRHNDVTLLWLHALFIYCTEGMIACYSYPKESDDYGTYESKTHEDSVENHEYVRCPNCGYNIDDTPLTPELMAIKAKIQQKEDEYLTDDDDVVIEDALQANPELEQCPNCLNQIAPQIVQEPLVVTKLVGTTNEPKTRICLEAYGGLYVKIANYAKKQADTPYLRYSYETHYSSAIERFENLHGNKRLTGKIRSETNTTNTYEELGRISPQYQGDYPENNVTVNNWWLRPSSFNVLSDKADIQKLKKKYPKGVRVVLVNDCFGESANEALDDVWTLTHNPLADFIHHDPLGLLLVSIQEITNDLVSLTLQTIEHGIPQTFVDPAVVDLDAYRQLEAIPGGIYEAKPKSGKSVGDAFHEVKTATLSTEVMPFAANIQSMAQLVSGALPSLFGGALEGSETASQYSMSRAQALQRQQNTWKMLLGWWKQIFGKAIPMFIKETANQGDEHEVQKNADGNFVNVFIRKAELEGKIGKVEIDANENLPITWAQTKDTIEKLFMNANPEVMGIIAAPENLSIIHDALGLVDFFVPGEDDIIKQYDEIKLLLNSEPIANPEAMDPMAMQMSATTGQPPPEPELPSVEIDVIFDNHKIQFEICRKWIISEAGRQAKTDNPVGYQNVLLHGKMHFQQMQMQEMQAQLAAQGPQDTGTGAAPPAKPKKDLKAPIQGEGDVHAK